MILPPPAPTLSDRMDDVLRYLATNRWISRPKKRGRWYLALVIVVTIGTIAVQIRAVMGQHSPPAVFVALVALPLTGVIDAVFSSYKERMEEWSSELSGPRHAAWRTLLVARFVLFGTGVVAAVLALGAAL